jgi:hypothetical protein
VATTPIKLRYLDGELLVIGMSFVLKEAERRLEDAAVFSAFATASRIGSSCPASSSLRVLRTGAVDSFELSVGIVESSFWFCLLSRLVQIGVPCFRSNTGTNCTPDSLPSVASPMTYRTVTATGADGIPFATI